MEYPTLVARQSISHGAVGYSIILGKLGKETGARRIAVKAQVERPLAILAFLDELD